MHINFHNSIFVVQKVPQATRVARGEKEIRCESETVPAAVSSILDGYAHAALIKQNREYVLSHSLPLTARPLGRRDRGNKSEDLPCALKDLGLQVYG